MQTWLSSNPLSQPRFYKRISMSKQKPFWELGLNPITMLKHVSQERELARQELQKQRKKRKLWQQLKKY